MAGTTIATNVPYPSIATPTARSTNPPITINTSPLYAQSLGELTGRAFATEPLTCAFAAERLGVSQITPDHVAAGNALRIARKLKLGAEIVEAGKWAAAACWEPPEADGGEPEITDEMRVTRPVFVGFLEQVASAKRRYLVDGDGGLKRYWHLSMMARDPARPDKGAVRAVIEPYIMRAREEGVPIWIEAGSARARDVYAYFGWRTLEEIRIGVDLVGESGYPDESKRGVPIWLMVMDP